MDTPNQSLSNRQSNLLMNSMSTKKVAFIGSFQNSKNYNFLRQLIRIFVKNGITVVSPAGSDPIFNRDGFIVFETDNKNFSSEKIQYDTLKNIFRANAVYVVDMDGYVGRTTCYEIGRLVERSMPMYFYQYPKDLPLCISDNQVINPYGFLNILKNSLEKFTELNCSICEKYKICIK